MRNEDGAIVETFASSKASELAIAPSSQANSRMLEDPRIFSYERYAQEVHPPISTGLLLAAGDLELPRCLDMPIRLAGQENYLLPDDWSILTGTLEQIIGLEHAHNRNWRDYNCYITVDSSPVEAGEQQRHGGLHVDGFQGERIEEKTKIARNYVATTNGGTIFWPQRFVVADPARFNVFRGFDLQTDGEPLVAEPNVFYFMDAYTVHESGFAEFDGLRTFVRVTFDLKIFDRLGNTHNPSLGYSWPMVERNVQKGVWEPRLSDVMESPYFP